MTYDDRDVATDARAFPIGEHETLKKEKEKIASTHTVNNALITLAVYRVVNRFRRTR